MAINRSRNHQDVAHRPQGTGHHLGLSLGFEAPEVAQAREWRRGQVQAKPKKDSYIGRILLKTEDAGRALVEELPGATVFHADYRFVAPLMGRHQFTGMSQGGVQKKLVAAQQQYRAITYRRQVVAEDVITYRPGPRGPITVGLVVHEVGSTGLNFLTDEHDGIREVTHAERAPQRQNSFLVRLAEARSRDEAEAVREIVTAHDLIGHEIVITQAVLCEASPIPQ